MFSKKKCNKCNGEIKKNFEFCPSCGNPLKENQWGMLGKKDGLPLQGYNEAMNPFNGITGNIFNKMLNNAMKMMEKEIQKEMNNQGKETKAPKTKVQLFINGKKVDFGEAGNQIEQKQPEQKNQDFSKGMSKKNLKKFSEFEREEPKTDIRRLSDKVIYELDMNGVKSLDDVSIIKLENSIEIKAIGKNKSYYKIIQIDLPIQSTKLSKNKLILELEAEN